MKKTYEITISNLKVDVVYYSFDYKVTIDGILHKEGSYDNSHAWGIDYKSFKELLKETLAFKTVLHLI